MRTSRITTSFIKFLRQTENWFSIVSVQLRWGIRHVLARFDGVVHGHCESDGEGADRTGSDLRKGDWRIYSGFLCHSSERLLSPRCRVWRLTALHAGRWLVSVTKKRTGDQWSTYTWHIDVQYAACLPACLPLVGCLRRRRQSLGSLLASDRHRPGLDLTQDAGCQACYASATSCCILNDASVNYRPLPCHCCGYSSRAASTCGYGSCWHGVV